MRYVWGIIVGFKLLRNGSVSILGYVALLEGFLGGLGRKEGRKGGVLLGFEIDCVCVGWFW